MLDGPREYAWFAVALLLVLGGTIAAGLLPGTWPSQALAGGIIVAGFAVAWLALGVEFRDVE
ncbi:hypothetical protein BRD09_03330 [Halobacteriales archaeon SW_10_68_16]|nr:MAG: hypothetical protein BRD09_03330 [Halobacteriales archaeon SW_10_68_16]